MYITEKQLIKTTTETMIITVIITIVNYIYSWHLKAKSALKMPHAYNSAACIF